MNSVENESYITEDIGENIIVEDVKTGSLLVNINTATQAELESVTGIGPSTALKIIKYREENGKFKTIEDIKNVSGIGNAKFETIKNEICVWKNLAKQQNIQYNKFVFGRLFGVYIKMKSLDL